jgi:hypothetical protein
VQGNELRARFRLGLPGFWQVLYFCQIPLAGLPRPASHFRFTIQSSGRVVTKKMNHGRSIGPFQNRYPDLNFVAMRYKLRHASALEVKRGA